MPRLVYFVKPVAMDGPIKIGCSISPMKRLLSLISWCPFDLELMAAAPGGLAEEKRLHQMFAADLLRAEWFRTSRELLALIEDVRARKALPFETVAGTRHPPMAGLPSILDRHGISGADFAAHAGVLPQAIYQWSRQGGRSPVGRVLATFDKLGIECPLPELFAQPSAPRASAA